MLKAHKWGGVSSLSAETQQELTPLLRLLCGDRAGERLLLPSNLSLQRTFVEVLSQHGSLQSNIITKQSLIYRNVTYFVLKSRSWHFVIPAQGREII